jgi:probable F420-dependent oxidoreductase
MTVIMAKGKKQGPMRGEQKPNMEPRVKFAFKLNVHGQPLDTPFERLLDLARHAEAVGFDGVYVIDHLVLPGTRLAGYTNADPARPYFQDCWTTLAAVAAITKRVKIGPQVTPIGLRHPAFVAKWGATIDHISGGRFLLQVGTGHQEIEYTSYGLPFPPFKIRYQGLLEGVRLIRALWGEERAVDFSGEIYQARAVEFWPKPVQRPSPPIWFGGASERIQRAVAQLGDGWTPAAPQAAGLDRAFYRDALKRIRLDAASYGRKGPIVGGALFYAAIAPTEAEAKQAASVLARRVDWAGLSLADLSNRGIAIVGTPDQAVRAIEKYVEAGVEYFTLGFIPLDALDATRRGMDLFAEKVMPRFS